MAEPETGGEGYIPLSPMKRARSTQVLTQIADMFGLDVSARHPEPPAALTAMPSVAAPAAAPARPSAQARQRLAASLDRSVNVAKIEVNGARNPERVARRIVGQLADLSARGYIDWDEWEDR